jgi:hypothetical protein
MFACKAWPVRCGVVSDEREAREIIHAEATRADPPLSAVTLAAVTIGLH